MCRTRQHICFSAQQFGGLIPGCLENILIRHTFLQELIGFQQQIGAVGSMRRLLGVAFHPVGQRTYNQRSNQHNQKSNRIALRVYHKGKPGRCKKEVKHQHAANSRQAVAAAGGGGHGCEKHGKQVYGDDICFCKAES